MPGYDRDELEELGMSEDEIDAIMNEDGGDTDQGNELEADNQGGDATDNKSGEGEQDDDGDTGGEDDQQDSEDDERDDDEGDKDDEQQEETTDDDNSDEDESGEGEQDGAKPEPEPAPRDATKAMQLPEEVAEEFKGRLNELSQKFDEGEIELSEFLDERDKINREIYNAEVVATTQANEAQRWKSAQDTFFAAEENAAYLQDEQRFNSLNIFVKAIANEGSSLSYSETLARAARMEQAMNGEVPTAEAVKPPEKPRDKPKSPRPEAPNLSDIPASQANNTNKGEFDHLDRLAGPELEAALERMSPEQQDRYLQST